MVIDGECFVLFSHPENGALQVRLIGAEQADGSLQREMEGGGRIVSAIEYDAASQRVPVPWRAGR